jgi:mannose-6-phosphate isomerase-like protein (cupin superfamily)
MPLPLEIVKPQAAFDRREFPFGRFDLFRVAGQLFGRAVYEPGWRWSQHVGPKFGAAWCEVGHIGFVISGRAAVKMKDGAEFEMDTGDWFSIPAGHDSWVLGDQQYVSVHTLGAHSYAAPKDMVATGDELAHRSPPASAARLPSSAWGCGCTGWTLLSRPDLHVMEEEMTTGTQELRHLHDRTTQLYYVLRGKAVVDVGGSRAAAGAGEAIEIQPGDAHQIRNDSDTGLRFLVISSGPPRDDRRDLTGPFSTMAGP